MSTLSLRLADDDYKALQAVALLTGKTKSEIVRAAIGETVARFAMATRHDLVQPDELARRRNALALLEGRAPYRVDSGRLSALHVIGAI
jgi:hypothetical protein